ncbi:MAG: DnaJ domain-containing protein [Candidatus Aminicenantes bacterium]|nr:DnaJ domain-containing protein [Candidatus Aminicenantes bacterium]
MGKRVIESPVPFVLRKILIEKISGDLTIRGENFEKSLYFSNGCLCFAKTNVLHERLGEVLFKIGTINQTQFWDIHRLISGQKNRLGRILIENSIISQKDLFFGLIHQVRLIALSTFALTSGEWEFSTVLPEIPDDSRFKIELPGIFVEGVPRFKSLALFKNSFAKRTVGTRPLPADIASFLKSEDLELLKKLDAGATGSSEKLAGEFGMADELFWQKLALFFFLNLVEFGDSGVKKELGKNQVDLLAFYERLKAGDVDHYDLFDLKNTATANEIKDVYFQLAKKYHPDRLGEDPDPELRDKANFVFARINKAFEVLSDEEKRREYDMKGYKELQGKEAAGENLVERANLYYRKAKTLYAQQRFREAASVLEEVVRNDPNRASYFLLLGLSQSNIPNLRRAAEKNFQRVIEMEPWNPEPYAALGLLFQYEKLEKRAENFFRKALAIDPDHELAKKRLSELSESGKKQSVFSLLKKRK